MNKQSEFVDQEEKKISPDVSALVGDMPDDVRDYMRENDALEKLDLIEGVSWYVYSYEKPIGNSNRKMTYVGKLEKRPEPDDLAELFGPGDYRFQAKWTAAGGKKQSLYSRVISISEKSRSPYAQATVAAPAPLVHAPVNPMAEMMANPGAMMEMTITLMERLAGIFGKVAPASSGNSLEAMQERQIKRLDDFFDNLLREKQKMMNAQLNPPKPESSDDVPAWLKPAMPLLEKLVDKLAGGGFGAAIAKETAMSDADFLAVMNDPQKWSQAVRVLAQAFGEEKVAKAIDVLQGVSDVAKAASGQGPRAKAAKGI